jgi:hypothetical protein
MGSWLSYIDDSHAFLVPPCATLDRQPRIDLQSSFQSPFKIDPTTL